MPKKTSKATVRIPVHSIPLKQHGSDGTIEVEASYDDEDLGIFKIGRSGIEHDGKRRGWPSLVRFLRKGKDLG